MTDVRSEARQHGDWTSWGNKAPPSPSISVISGISSTCGAFGKPIAVFRWSEKLQIKKMTRKARKGSKRKRQKTGFNRSILDVGIGMLKQAIKYKATKYKATDASVE